MREWTSWPIWRRAASSTTRTDREALAARLAAGPITLYYGFDPTADSLHIGNLIGVLVLRRFQDAGHRPIALAGGATGMVGDPSGRSEERNLLDDDQLAANLAGIRAQLERLLDFSGPGRRAGGQRRPGPRHSRCSTSSATSASTSRSTRWWPRSRCGAGMEGEDGISYTEFSYMLLQANDYLWLHEHEGCELQIGGSDQWGNITAGIDLDPAAGGSHGPRAHLAPARPLRRPEVRQDGGRQRVAVAGAHLARTASSSTGCRCPTPTCGGSCSR